MGKGKQGQARKKAPPPEDKDDKEEEVQDDEMQLQFSTKSQKTTMSTVNTSSTSTPLTAKIMKECDGSISTNVTSNDTILFKLKGWIYCSCGNCYYDKVTF